MLDDDEDRADPVNETLLAVTLPLAAWRTLRGVARWAARHDRREAERYERLVQEGSRPPLKGRNLDIFRAEKLEAAADAIDQAVATVDATS